MEGKGLGVTQLALAKLLLSLDILQLQPQPWLGAHDTVSEGLPNPQMGTFSTKCGATVPGWDSGMHTKSCL